MHLPLRRSFRVKLITIFMSVTMPCFILIGYHNWYGMEVVREQAVKSTTDLLEVYMGQVDGVLSDIERYLLNTASGRMNLMGFLLLYDQDSPWELVTKMNIVEFLESDIRYFKLVDYFYVYVEDRDYFLATKRFHESTDQETAEQKQKLRQLMTPERMGNWHVVKHDRYSEAVRFVAVSPGIYIGASVPMPSLIAPLQQVDLGQGGELLLASIDGDPLTPHKRDEAEWAELAELLKTPYSASQSFRSGQGERSLIVKEFSLHGFVQLVAAIPEKQLLHSLPYFQLIILLLPIAFLIVILLFLFLLQRALVRPMAKLIRGMKRIASGDWGVRLKLSQTSELYTLGETFNYMAEEVQNLKLEVYEERLRVQQESYKYLQSQIHPHFFLNSLNIVYSMAAANQTGTVMKMALYLTKYFRFIMQEKEEIVLQEEMEHIRNYLIIQQLRFPRQITFDIPDEDKLDPVMVPPSILQPFVENAIIHGFQRRSEPFHLSVRTSVVNISGKDIVEITISDTGVGITSSVLSQLQEESYESIAHKHVGIVNVWRRLRLKWGTDTQLAFYNNEQGGAVVVMRIPFIKQTEG